jgi:hypothetical protein
VRTAALWDLLSERRIEPSTIAFVWADVQGSEGHVIATARELWKAGVPLYIEVLPAALRRVGTIDRVAAAGEFGFRGFITAPDLIRTDEPAVRPIGELPGLIDSFTGTDQTDILLIPESWPPPADRLSR